MMRGIAGLANRRFPRYVARPVGGGYRIEVGCLGRCGVPGPHSPARTLGVAMNPFVGWSMPM